MWQTSHSFAHYMHFTLSSSARNVNPVSISWLFIRRRSCSNSLAHRMNYAFVGKCACNTKCGGIGLSSCHSSSVCIHVVGQRSGSRQRHTARNSAYVDPPYMYKQKHYVLLFFFLISAEFHSYISQGILVFTFACVAHAHTRVHVEMSTVFVMLAAEAWLFRQ